MCSVRWKADVAAAPITHSCTHLLAPFILAHSRIRALTHFVTNTLTQPPTYALALSLTQSRTHPTQCFSVWTWSERCVSRPRLVLLPHSITYSWAHSLVQLLLAHSRIRPLRANLHTHTLAHSLTHSLTHTRTHSLTHSLTQHNALLFGRAACSAQVVGQTDVAAPPRRSLIHSLTHSLTHAVTSC